MAYAVAKIVL
ncbi:hypothetical protein CP03DC29_1161A, partial [Chlamydia psittaci 03DC29]